MAVDIAAIGLDSVNRKRADFVKYIDGRINDFFDKYPISDANLILHSTGVNFGHQFYVLSLIGRHRLGQFKSVNLISGSVISAIVYYSYRTGNLQWGKGDASRWERHFFRSHGLTPLKSAVVIPYKLLSRKPILSSGMQMDVIRTGIGEAFGKRQISFFPPNFRFWLFDETANRLICATSENEHNHLRMDQLAVAAAAVPGLLGAVQIAGRSFVDPMFSSGRDRLTAELARLPGPNLISNMLVDRSRTIREFVRPHMHDNGRLLMARELVQFCFGLSNRDHVDALEIGLIDLGSCME